MQNCKIEKQRAVGLHQFCLESQLDGERHSQKSMGNPVTYQKQLRGYLLGAYCGITGTNLFMIGVKISGYRERWGTRTCPNGR